VIAAANSSALAPAAALTVPGATEFAWSGGTVALLTDVGLTLAAVGAQPLPAGASALTAANLSQSAAAVSAGAHALTAAGGADGAAELAWAAPDPARSGEVVHLWNPLLALEEATLPVTGTVTGMAFDQPAGQLAVATSAGEVLLYQRASGDQVTFPTDGFLTALAFSPESSLLAGADPAALTVDLLDARSGVLVRTLAWEDSAAPNLQLAAFSPGWKLVALAGRGAVALLDVASGQLVTTLLHEDAVTALAWTPAGDLLATAAAATLDGALQPAVSLWRADGSLAARLPLPAAVLDLAFSPDGRTLAALLAGGSLVTLTVP
jgi:WD40 repeat protein